MPAQSPSPGLLHSLWMWLVLILISGTLSSSTMWQMRTTQQPSSVLTVSISLRHTTPSLLTTSVLVMSTCSLSSQSMELARERAVLSLDVPIMVTFRGFCGVCVCVMSVCEQPNNYCYLYLDKCYFSYTGSSSHTHTLYFFDPQIN